MCGDWKFIVVIKCWLMYFLYAIKMEMCADYCSMHRSDSCMLEECDPLQIDLNNISSKVLKLELVLNGWKVKREKAMQEYKAECNKLKKLERYKVTLELYLEQTNNELAVHRPGSESVVGCCLNIVKTVLLTLFYCVVFIIKSTISLPLYLVENKCSKLCTITRTIKSTLSSVTIARCTCFTVIMIIFVTLLVIFIYNNS